MLIPISFGIGATLTALVGTNIGARQYARAQRMAWTGALMAGCVAATIGIVVAIWPDLWLGLFTRDPGATCFQASLSVCSHVVIWRCVETGLFLELSTTEESWRLHQAMGEPAGVPRAGLAGKGKGPRSPSASLPK